VAISAADQLIAAHQPRSIAPRASSSRSASSDSSRREQDAGDEILGLDADAELADAAAIDRLISRARADQHRAIDARRDRLCVRDIADPLDPRDLAEAGGDEVGVIRRSKPAPVAREIRAASARWVAPASRDSAAATLASASAVWLIATGPGANRSRPR